MGSPATTDEPIIEHSYESSGLYTATLTAILEEDSIGQRVEATTKKGKFVVAQNWDEDLMLSSAATSTTVLTPSPTPNPSVFGQSVTLSATVTGSSGTPTGSVTFKDSSTVLGTSNLSVSGVATLNVSNLSAGSHNLTGVYSGDSTYDPSTYAHRYSSC